ncbi:MAG: anti-sigma factor [Actinomycetota bacterium]|nr:anti-sigma factor [Actinomycetota bacterium]
MNGVDADVHTLSGAYALDALPADECAFFERHLQACTACRSEVDELVATAAVLAGTAAARPPAQLRARVLDQVDVTRQLPPDQLVPSPDTRQSLLARLRPALPSVAAALALAVVVLTSMTANLNQRVDGLEQELAADSGDAQAAEDLLPILAAADALTSDLRAEGDQTVRYIHSARLDRGVLVSDGMAPLAPAKTYQVWLFHDQRPVPAGLFEPDGAGQAIAVLEEVVAGAEGIAVTIEPRGGSPEPTGRIVARSDV